MKISIIGAGAIGSVAAGYLTKAGQDTALIGRMDQVETIQRSGLNIKGVRGSETVKIKILPRLDQEYDLVIFTVKTQDLEFSYQENCGLLENALVLTTQNGVQADNILSSHFDPERMLNSIVMFGATYVRPGEAALNFEGDWIIGRPFTPVDPVVHAVADILRQAFPVVVAPNIMGMKWLKLFVNFNNCIPALTGRSMQETFSSMEMCRLSVMLLKEGVSIVQRAGIKMVSLPQFPVDRIYGLVNMPTEQAAEIIQKTLTSLSREPLYGSILQSILRQRPSEIDFINGEVVHMANQMRLDAPLNRKVVDLVHQVEQNRKFFEPAFVEKEFQLS